MPQRRSAPLRRPLTVRSLLVGLALLTLVFLYQEGYLDRWLGLPLRAVFGPAPPQATSSSGSVTAYFTTPALVYPDERDRRRPPPFESALIADIDAAQTSVDMAVFEYNLTSIAAALVRAQQRGVTVRLALDRENLEKPEMAAWAGQVEAAGIPVAWEDSTAFLHSKFVIIDSAVVWMGSWNATNNDTYRNNNNLLRITAPAIVANYSAEFAQMFAGVFGNDKQPLAPYPLVDVDGVALANYFSPADGVTAYVLDQVNAAQQSIRFLAFSYTSDPIGDAMMARAQAGVSVQGVFENRNANGIGSEFDRLRNAGIEVQTDGNCYTMHHKVLIIDERLVVTGSFNFTGRAEDINDENVIIAADPLLTRSFLDEYERVYRQALVPTRCN